MYKSTFPIHFTFLPKQAIHRGRVQPLNSAFAITHKDGKCEHRKIKSTERGACLWSDEHNVIILTQTHGAVVYMDGDAGTL